MHRIIAFRHAKRFTGGPEQVTQVLRAQRHLFRGHAGIRPRPQRAHRQVKDALFVHPALPRMIKDPHRIHVAAIGNAARAVIVDPGFHRTVAAPEIRRDIAVNLIQKAARIAMRGMQRTGRAIGFDAARAIGLRARQGALRHFLGVFKAFASGRQVKAHPGKGIEAADKIFHDPFS